MTNSFKSTAPALGRSGTTGEGGQIGLVMSTFEAHRTAFVTTLDRMLTHPQGHHGWDSFYEALRLNLSSGSRPIPEPLRQCWLERPELNLAHVATLLGMAVRQVAALEDAAAAVFRRESSASERAEALSWVLETWSLPIGRTLLDRHNSFTGARRFLVPQLILGNHTAMTGVPIRFLDIGTGIGILPRQINQRRAFDRFIVDLAWECDPLPYRHIPIESLDAIDKPPLPDLNWVSSCFGPSRYYRSRFNELMWCLSLPPEGPPVTTSELDVLDRVIFERHLRLGRYNAITCNFVLYQYEMDVRDSIIRTIKESLPEDGIFVSMELDPSMSRPGCQIMVYYGREADPLHIMDVSDAHLIGSVSAGVDYEKFRRICKL